MYKKLTAKNLDESIFDLGELIRIERRIWKRRYEQKERGSLCELGC